MTDLRTAAQQLLGAICAALPYAPHRAEFDVVADTADALRAALAQQAEPALQTCNCRWDGDVQVQQCTLHEAHVDAIHEWAERAKVAERKLAQQAEPVGPVAQAMRDAAVEGADRDSRGMFVARLENMQKHGDHWLTVQAVLALLNDCDMRAARERA